MNAKYLLVFLTTLITITSFGQKFGKVSDQEVISQFHPIDTVAHAAYLLAKCDARYTFRDNITLNLEYHYRIKVYDYEGESYGNFEIPLYVDGSTKESIKNLEGYTFNYEDGKIKKIKLDKDNVHEEKTSKNWKYVKFAMPNVKAGSIIEIKYRKITPYIYSIPRWYFQSEIPTNYSQYSIALPQYFTLTPIPTGTVYVEKEEKPHFPNDHGEIDHIFVAKNVPALKDDDYVLNINDYRSSIKYEIHAVSVEGQPTQYLSKDWNTICKNLMDSKSFGKELTKNIEDHNPILSEARNLSSDIEKVELLYSYLISNYKWNKNYGIIPETGLNNLHKEKSGNVADINILLINLLKKSGIKAFPLVLKSRFSGVFNSSFPNRTGLNYILAYVNLDQGPLLLDATSKYVPSGQLPIRAINISGILVGKETAEIIEISNPNIYVKKSMANYKVDLEVISLNGSGQQRLSKYGAVKYRIDQDNLEDDEDNQDYSEEEDINLEDEVVVLEEININNISMPVSIKFEETKYNSIRKIGDQIFIDANLDEGISKNPFAEDSRDFPIFYNYKVDIKDIKTIEIPEGYEIESLPERVAVALPKKMGLFNYEVNTVNNMLSINYTLKINTDIFNYLDYPALKMFYTVILETQNKKIILKAKS